MSRKGQLDGLQLRRRLGPKQWGPPRPFGPDGWILDRRSEPESRIIISCAKHDNSDWVHASISRPNSMPTYEDLTQLHSAVFQDGYAYQVFAPRVDHVNIHPFCLHLWGRLDGAPALPIFAMNGSI